MSSITIRGQFAEPEREFSGAVEVDLESGLITKVTGETAKADFTAAPDEVIFAGFGDIHIHAREDCSRQQVYKEDFITASDAAVFGGVVQVADMPNNPTAPVDDERYRAKQKLTSVSLVNVTLYAGIGPGTKPLSFDAPYKAYMGPSVGDLFFRSQSELEETIQNYRGQNVSFHCEDPELLESHKGETTHEARRPPQAELLATDFALYLIEEYKLRGKLCHYSVGSGLEKILRAKQRGISVTCEVTPHHLFFDETMFTTANRVMLQINPPIRGPEDRTILIEALRRGEIDYLATDHAPHTLEEKARGVSGVPHLDTYGAFATWLMREHRFTPQDIARVCSRNPGTFVNDFSPLKFGKIEPGYAGSFTVLNPNQPHRILREDLRTKCGWSPFEGFTFPGRVTATIIKGRVYKH